MIFPFCVCLLFLFFSTQILSNLVGQGKNEVVIKEEKYEVDGEYVDKIFTVDVPQNGNYFISAWIMGTCEDNEINEFSYYINNNKKSPQKIKPSKDGWQSLKLKYGPEKKKKSVYFKAGTHTIAFRTKAPETPAVEFIRMSTNEEEVALSDTAYNNYVAKLKSYSWPITSDQSSMDSLANDGTLKSVLPDPAGYGIHRIHQLYGYTFFNTYYLSQGQSYTWSIENANALVVLRIFKKWDPLDGTWAVMGNNPSITTPITQTGSYYVVITAYNSGQAGTCDLYRNSVCKAHNVPFNNWCGIPCYHSSTEELNYFTSSTSENPIMWIENNDYIGKFVAWNDNYSGPGNFPWGYNARVKQAFTCSIRSTHVTAEFSYNPIDYADVYMNYENYTNTMFPNLEPDDAIKSGSDDYIYEYNCAAWAGGRTSTDEENYFFWPPNDFNPWHYDQTAPQNSTEDLESFKNYFGNKVKVSGQWVELCRGTQITHDSHDVAHWAYNYVLDDNHEDEAVVALWGGSDSNFKHAAVRKPGNDHPHGYDWESKLAWNKSRIFHPRDALSGGEYYSILHYFRLPDENRICYGVPADQQKIQSNGLALYDKVEYSPITNNKIKSFSKLVATEKKDYFNSLYEKWKETWKSPSLIIHSDPREYAKSDEYKEFLSVSKKIGKGSWPLMFEKYMQGDELAANAILDLTLNEYESLLDSIRTEGNKRAIKKGLIPTQKANTMRYIMRVLDKLTESDIKSSNDESFIYKYDENDNENIPKQFILSQNYPNPFNMSTTFKFGLPKETFVTLKVYNMLGQEIAVLLNKEYTSAGWHTVKWNGLDKNNNSIGSGIYFYKLAAGNHVLSNKLIVVK